MNNGLSSFHTTQLWCLWRLPQEDSGHSNGFAPRVTSKIILDDKNIEIEGKFNPASQHVDAVADATKMEQEATSGISNDDKSVVGRRVIKLEDGLNTQSNVIQLTERATLAYFGQERDLMLRISILIALMCLVVLLLTLIALIIACAYWKIMYCTQRQCYLLTCCDKHVGDSKEYLSKRPGLTDQKVETMPLLTAQLSIKGTFIIKAELATQQFQPFN